MPLSSFAKGKIASGKFAALHTGDPGPDCTDNPAKQSLRVSVTLDGSGASTSALQWPLCPANETFTHVSLWDAATGGNPWISGALATPEAVAVNQLFEIAAGKLTVALK